jgi:hypothetical protein
LTPTLAANQLAGKRHPDRTETELNALKVPDTKKKKKKLNNPTILGHNVSQHPPPQQPEH